MIIYLLSALVLAIVLYHSFIWKPLDTSILYKHQPYLLFGHRGSPLHEPENTIASFQRAITDGCNAIELDVHRSRDGHFVVFHDDTLERTSNGTGRVAEHTLTELKALNAATEWEGRQEQIPTLQEVVDALPDTTIFNFEIKNFSFFSVQHTELELVRFIRENKMRDRVILSSFNPLSIWRVKISDPRIFTALLWFNPSILSLRHPLGVHLAHPDLFHPCEENMNWGVKFWSRVKNIPMHVWVVNDEEKMKTFAVDPMIKGIMTDNAKLLVETIGHKLH
ncbi:MAG: hypothetical protein HOB84_00615 [Candidatus Marinimicrobia bacterium]|jgi:glycerophosphoryl diester phosphodiesterase|nr:hypothetical protein [Candidatus Neomarinimicrobiota bacterium]MBT4359979.1 hypothetical protein [Candidatus Neomarinimicrobiota bacterium]MBT4713258.1 hypothetical protein [Candidatus Neomarinimicrobiota bacterium]MBT4946304.1 hypothetical protein [Candidatus Neomarinimicrobiota bacterium]MBT5268058.1 hypothetical protein [Candidatus Neomarinimicrobiota bacterium]